MQIGQAVYEALNTNQEGLFGVVADWIEEFMSDHPEAETYLERLRTPNIRVRTIIDVVCKFGCRRERKLYARVNRIVLELRHKPQNGEKMVTDLFSLEGRKQIRRILDHGTTRKKRKKPVLMSMKKCHALHNDIWYMKELRRLLGEYYK